jgi:phospholipase/lecithinase/hemolysin
MKAMDRSPCAHRKASPAIAGSAGWQTVLLGLLLLACRARAGWTSMYIFGDSLSAVAGGGTQYPPPPGASAANYWNGRFSNGQVWVEYLAAEQGIPFNTNNDFSNFGDASDEAYQNITAGNYYPPPDVATSLCVYWTACSDCFLLAYFDATNSWTNDINLVMESVSASVEALYSQGTRTLLLPNSVDVSRVPFFNYALGALSGNTNDIPALLAAIQVGVPQYNAALASTIATLRSNCPNLTIYAPDFYTQFNFVLNHPASYGLTVTAVDALEDTNLTDKSFAGPGANYLFWDYLHPTTKVHAFVADYAQQAIAPLLINRLARAGASNRLDLANLPLGRTGSLQSSTNLAQTNWTTRATVAVTNLNQTVFIPTNGLGNPIFFRLNFPP